MDISHIVILSLIITANYKLFADGNALSGMRVWFANQLDSTVGRRWSRIIQKPLWDCLPCMASFWTIVLTLSFNVPLMLAVCGLNTIIERWLSEDDIMPTPDATTEYFDDVPTISCHLKDKHGPSAK